MDNTFHRFHASFTSALAEAGRVCVIWRRPGDDRKYNIFEMDAITKDYDAENPLEPGSCYEVSVEGAIGYCPGRQYLTRWLFYPAMDDASILELVKDMAGKAVEIQAEEKAGAKARFCPNCGSPYRNDNVRFCPVCGTPRE